MSEIITSETNNVIQNNSSVVFLRQKLGVNAEDRYMIDIALALKSYGYKVSFYTNKLEHPECFEELDPIRGCFPVFYSGSWIPNHILGMFKKTMIFLKSLWLIWRIIFLPPRPKPEFIILDVHPLGLTLLKIFTKFRTIYIHNFSMVHSLESTEYRHLTPHNEIGNVLNHANEIVVQTRCLAEVFRHFYPTCRKQIKVVCPCVDEGFWNGPRINLSRIIPDLPRDAIMFVAFGDYRKKSNFKLALDAMEYLISMVEEPMRSSVHLVIAGHCRNKYKDQLHYYDELVEMTSEKPYGSQVSFMRQLPTAHKRALIENCVAVIHPAKNDPFPGPILAAMSLGKSIIAVNKGFPEEVLTHRISGILLDPQPEKFATAMLKLATKPTVRHFIGEMARDTFKSHFTFDDFSRKIHSVVLTSRKIL